MKKADLITGTVLLILSGYVIYEALQMPESGTFGPGSGFLPLWLGILMGVLALLLTIGAALRREKTSAEPPFPAWSTMAIVAKILGGLMVFSLLMETVGFIINTLIFVTYLMKVVQKERWPKSLLIAVATTACLYIVFQVLLGITLPRNELF
jgi:hypothetical protein